MAAKKDPFRQKNGVTKVRSTKESAEKGGGVVKLEQATYPFYGKSKPNTDVYISPKRDKESGAEKGNTGSFTKATKTQNKPSEQMKVTKKAVRKGKLPIGRSSPTLKGTQLANSKSQRYMKKAGKKNGSK
jgi:hypothetical protein